MDIGLAKACVADPEHLVSTHCKLLQHTINEYKCEHFVCLDGFRNVQNVYNCEGVKLELDETHFSFGTVYEIHGFF